MNQEYIHIENLLERFFEGKTSNSEEAELYKFFRNSDIPAHLQPYKQMFEYFESGIKDEPATNDVPLLPAKRKYHKGWIAITAVAASVLLLIMIKSVFITQNDMLASYKGSYMIINGKKTCDMEAIKAEDLAIMNKIEEKEKELYNMNHSLDSKINEYLELERKVEKATNPDM